MSPDAGDLAAWCFAGTAMGPVCLGICGFVSGRASKIDDPADHFEGVSAVPSEHTQKRGCGMAGRVVAQD
jgi:hypothetical protein